MLSKSPTLNQQHVLVLHCVVDVSLPQFSQVFLVVIQSKSKPVHKKVLEKYVMKMVDMVHMN